MTRRTISIYVLIIVSVAVVALVGVAGARNDKYPTETVFDEEFSVKSGGLLDLSVGDMDVEISPGGKDGATVKVIISGPDLDKAREYYEKMNFDADVSGNKLIVDTQSRRSWVQFDWNKYRNVSVKVIITLPKEFDVDARTSDGDVTAQRLEGDIRLKTSDGDVDVSDLQGIELRMVTSDGDVVAHDINADNIWMKTSDGDVLAEDFEGDEIGLSTSDGDVTVTRMDAKIVGMSTSDGDITVKQLSANSTEIKTSDGDVSAVISGEELRIKTSDGDIDLKIDGNMAISLSTSDGNIMLSGPASLKADLNLKGDRVRVIGGLNIDGEVGNHRVIGKLNNGGPKISARASDGTVALKLR